MVRADADATRRDGESSRARELREALARGEFVTVRAGTYDGWVTAKRRRVDRRARCPRELENETQNEVATSLIEVLVFELAAALAATLRARWSAPPPSYCCSAP